MIRYGNDYILIENVREENVLNCVEARRMNQASFFGKVVSDTESEEWIRRHMETPDNILLEIIYRPLNCFIGTIGFVIQDNEIEIGRLSIYSPAIKKLIHIGIDPEQLHKVMETVSILTIAYLFKHTNAELLSCNILANNRYSNALCIQLGGISQKIQQEYDGVLRDVLHYELTRKEYLNRGKNEKELFILPAQYF